MGINLYRGGLSFIRAMKSRHLSIGKETAPRWRSLRVLQVREGTFEWKMPDAGLFPASPSYKLDLKFFLYVMFLVKSLPAPNCLQMSLGCKLFCQKFLCSPGGFRSLAFQLFFFLVWVWIRGVLVRGDAYI